MSLLIRVLPKLAALIVVAGLCSVARSSHAAAPYQGLYVIINPYDQAAVSFLKTASQAACVQNPQTVTTPFCGATNAIMLRIPWCDFQLYHLNNTHGQPYRSCHYVVGFSGAVGTPGVQIPSTDLISPCAGIFDTCIGHATSVLATSLRYIVQINTLRANAGLPALKLSVGLFAGIGTPQSILDTVGYVDVPHTLLPASDPSRMQCFRLPLHWNSRFLTSYDQAFDQLLAYLQAQMPGGTNIVIAKAAAISAVDFELEMPGRANAVPVPADPGPAGAGSALACSSNIPGAQIWLNAYNANPIANNNLSQANESAFGTVIGHELGSLANAGLKGTLMSVATTNGSGFPYVDCGATGASTCTVGGNTGEWATYYLEYYVNDLFNGGLAYTQAAAAYGAIRHDTFSFPPQQFAMNSTALSPTAIDSSLQLSCTLNNTNPTYAQPFTLDSIKQRVLGTGTIIGWQTAVEQGQYCSAGALAQSLTNGISDGGLYVELETDVAFTYINQCNASLTPALTQLMALSPPTTCSY